MNTPVHIERLPRMIERAAAALANATTAAEVLDAKDQATAAATAAHAAAQFAKKRQAHAEVIAACHRAHADALAIEAAAQCRLADEYDAAQERGEVQKAGGDRKSINVLKKNNDRTVTHIGLDRKQIHEARQIRNAEKAEPGIVRRALDEQLRAGEEPSRSHVKRTIANDKGNKGNRRFRPKQIDPVKDKIVAFADEGASSTEIAAAPTSSSQSEPAPWMIPAAWGLELLAKNRTMAVLIDHLAPLADELKEENKALDEENTKLVDDYNKLVGDYNELLDDHHKLLGIPSAEEVNDDAAR